MWKAGRARSESRFELLDRVSLRSQHTSCTSRFRHWFGGLCRSAAWWELWWPALRLL